MDSKSTVLTESAVKGFSDLEVKRESNAKVVEKKNIDDNYPYLKWERTAGTYHLRRSEKVENLCKKKYRDLKEELLTNNLIRISVADWNNTIQKSLVILRTWTGKSIRSTHDIDFDGPNKNWHWSKNENIKACDLLAFKIYTDFNRLQYELTRTLWENLDQIDEFFHWKTLLDKNIRKFGYNLCDKNDTIYHGVNPFMVLDNNLNIPCISPLSASTKREVARSFATKHGFIIELKTLYPNKDLDYAFDVSAISDYPEEYEILVGLLHPRIMNIESGLASVQEFGASMVDSQTARKMIFFVGTLFIKQKFSMDHKLEELLISVLNYNKNKNHVQFKPAIEEYVRIMNEKIENDNKDTKDLKLDIVSNNLKTYFMDEKHYDQKNNKMENNDYWRISFKKVFETYPNLTHIRLYNHYLYDEQFRESFVHYLSQNKKIKLEYVCFSYYGHTCEKGLQEYDRATKLKIVDWNVEVDRQVKKRKEPRFKIELKKHVKM